MGIKGLFRFLSRYEIHTSITQAVKGKLVGMDMFWFLHQSKGNREIMEHYLRPIIQYAKEVHCVWDGPPSLQTKEQREEREQKRQETIQMIDHLDTFIMNQIDQLTEKDQYVVYDYAEKLRKQVWKPTPEYIYEIKQWLAEEGCYQYTAMEEADDLLMELECENTINMIVTNDSDLITMGSACVLRIHNSTEGTLYQKDKMCFQWGLTPCQWKDFMTVCRSMKVPDIHIAYSLIRVYRNLDTILEKQRNGNIYHECNEYTVK